MVFLELRKKYPVFDPFLLKIRKFFLPVLSALILFAALFTVVFLMPFYLVKPMGFSIDFAGYTMAIPFLCLFFLSPFSGALSDRIGTRALCTIGMVILAASLFFMSRLSASASFYSIAWRLILMGIGTAIFLPPNSSIVMSILPPHRRGIASGTVATARNIGMMIGVTQAGLIFNMVFRMKSGGQTLTVYNKSMEPFFMAAFQYAMLSGAFLACLGVFVAFMRGSDRK